MTSETVISTEAVYRRFGDKDVLRGVDLAVPRGSVVGLLGKNAAGKTTLIKCLLGLLRTDDGTIRVLGEDPWWLSADAKARLGYVPQEVSLYGWMRVGQIIHVDIVAKTRAVPRVVVITKDHEALASPECNVEHDGDQVTFRIVMLAVHVRTPPGVEIAERNETEPPRLAA